MTRVVGVLIAVFTLAGTAPPVSADWVTAAREVRRHYRDTDGRERIYVASFGDSMTVSQAYWLPLKYMDPATMPVEKTGSPRAVQALEWINRVTDPYRFTLTGAKRRGSAAGSMASYALKVDAKTAANMRRIDYWLQEDNPAIAIIQWGSNELPKTISAAAYQANLREIVRTCKANGTIPILMMFPPRHEYDDWQALEPKRTRAAALRQAVRDLAVEQDVLLVDFAAEILARNPENLPDGTWDGADSIYSAYVGYQVPTSIARDGLHPSSWEPGKRSFAEEALRTNGYMLRTYLALMGAYDVYEAAILPGSAPLAASQHVTAAEDTAVTITLGGNDADLDTLGFSIETPPAHGTLGGTPPSLTYTPAPGFVGIDTFTFTASDGTLTSEPATVTVTVVPNSPPVATPQEVTTTEDDAVAVTLGGSDPDGDEVSFSVDTLPANGTLSGTPPSLTYTPSADFHGTDRFTFTASDGMLTSAPAMVTITVTPVNDAPVATPQEVTTTEDDAVAVTLGGSDPDGDEVSFSVDTLPANGTLSGTPPSLTYTPSADFHGTDRFTFTASDGMLTSAPATVTITVTPVNDAPVATPQEITTAEDGAVAVTLGGSDPDGDEVSFSVDTLPANGTLSGTPPSLTYTPSADFHGTDRFTFTASDGMLTSAPATVTITVTPVNDAPVATPQEVTTTKNTTVALTLAGSDPDGDEVSFSVDTLPANGTLSGTPPSVFYTPARNFHGTDRFTFTVSDGALTGAPATVTVTVTPGPGGE